MSTTLDNVQIDSVQSLPSASALARLPYSVDDDNSTPYVSSTDAQGFTTVPFKTGRTVNPPVLTLPRERKPKYTLARRAKRGFQDPSNLDSRRQPSGKISPPVTTTSLRSYVIHHNDSPSPLAHPFSSFAHALDSKLPSVFLPPLFETEVKPIPREIDLSGFSSSPMKSLPNVNNVYYDEKRHCNFPFHLLPPARRSRLYAVITEFLVKKTRWEAQSALRANKNRTRFSMNKNADKVLVVSHAFDFLCIFPWNRMALDQVRHYLSSAAVYQVNLTYQAPVPQKLTIRDVCRTRDCYVFVNGFARDYWDLHMSILSEPDAEHRRSLEFILQSHCNGNISQYTFQKAVNLACRSGASFRMLHYKCPDFSQLLAAMPNFDNSNMNYVSAPLTNVRRSDSRLTQGEYDAILHVEPQLEFQMTPSIQPRPPFFSSNPFEDMLSSDTFNFMWMGGPEFIFFKSEFMDFPHIFRWICNIYLYATCKSWSQWTAIFMGSLTDMTLCGISDSIIRPLMSMAGIREMLPEYRYFRFQYQAGADETPTEDGPGTDGANFFALLSSAMTEIPYAALRESKLLAALWDVLGLFTVGSIFKTLGLAGDESMFKKLVASISPLLRRSRGGDDPLDTFFAKLIKFGRICCERVIAAFQARDLSLLFSKDVTVTEWFEWTSTLLMDSTILFEPGNVARITEFKKRLISGDYPSQITEQLTREQKIASFDRSTEIGQGLETYLKEDHIMRSRVLQRLREVSVARTLLMEQLPNGSFRIQPFGLFITGTPGVGKSTICSELHAACARASNHTPDASGIMRVDASSNFADTSIPGQTTVFFDDIDAKLAPVTAGHDSHVDIVNKYINNAPFNLEKAAVEDKGKHWCTFDLALYTTNYPDGRLMHHCAQPWMFWRRFPYRIDITVKKEFQDGAGGVSPCKITNPDGSTMVDFQIFTVYICDGSMFHESTAYMLQPYRLVQTFLSKREFFAFITEKYLSWTADQKRFIIKRNASFGDTHFCPRCRLTLENHPMGAYCDPSVEVQFGVDPRDVLVTSPSMIVYLLIYLCGYPFLAITLCLLSLGSNVYAPIVAYIQPFWQEYGWFYLTWCLYRVSPPLWWWIYFRSHPRVLIRSISAVHDRQRYHAFFSQFTRSRAAKLSIGMTALAVAYYTYQRKYRDSKDTYFQMDPEDGVWKEYRRPPGIPLGDSKYTRKTQPELVSYGVRAVKPTFTYAEFQRVISRRMMRVVTKNGTAHAFRLKGSIIVMNRHLISHATTAITRERPLYQPLMTTPLTLVFRNQSYTIGELDFSSRIQEVTGSDIVFVHVPELPPIGDTWNLVDYLTSTPHVESANMDETWLIGCDDEDPLHALDGSTCRRLAAPLDGIFWQTSIITKNTQCGSVLVGRSGAYFSILGIHSLLYDGKIACATPLLREDYERTLARFSDLGAALELQMDAMQIKGYTLDFTVGALPNKSSLRVALSDPEVPVEATVIGSIHGLPGQTNRTSIVDTFFRNHPEVVVLESSLGSNPYFAAPKFGGTLYPLSSSDETGQPAGWRDPFTKFLASVENIPGDRYIWELALDDYLEGVTGLAQHMVMEPLSDFAAFFGVPDTDIGGTNLSTSGGPPFYTKKEVFIKCDHTTTPPSLEWTVGFQNQLDAIDLAIRGGDLYAPFCLHVLKDEVLTVEKNRLMKVRAFTILPYAFNHYMKRFLAPLTAFMRQHMYYFESAVGMNITSLREGGQLASWLEGNPFWIAFDKSSFDAKCSTFEHLTVSRFFYRLALLCGYTSDDADIVFRLCLSSIYPIRSIKSDLFMLTCSMPTGFWMTIHFNCVRSSLQARYAWYDLSRPVKANYAFRAHVRQMCLGDDLVATVSGDVPWYNQIAIANSLKAIGAVATSSEKDRALTLYDHRTFVRFLKRRITSVEGYVCWAIEEKTLIKMLCMRRSSKFLDDRDSHAITLMNVLAESWMYGRDRFSFYQSLCFQLSNIRGIRESSYWNPLSFDEYVNKYARGELITWEHDSKDRSHILL